MKFTIKNKLWCDYYTLDEVPEDLRYFVYKYTRIYDTVGYNDLNLMSKDDNESLYFIIKYPQFLETCDE